MFCIMYALQSGLLDAIVICYYGWNIDLWANLLMKTGLYFPVGVISDLADVKYCISTV